MTAGEASALLVDTVRELSAARRECESWRLVALATMQHAADLHRELAMVDERSYVYRTRTADRLDVFLDQRDLRIQEAAA